MTRTISILALLLTGCASVNFADTPLDRFADMFPGRYDSHAQTVAEAASNLPEAERNYRRHSIFRHVELPAFGLMVFLAHQYRDGDPDAVYRQRLYTLFAQDDGFVLRVHVPKTEGLLDGAYRDPSRLAELTPDDFTVWDGCDLFWQREMDNFVGRLHPGSCRFKSEAYGQEIVLEETLTLSEDWITFADRGLSLDGDWLFGMRSDTPNISMKARPFLCERNGKTAWLHDQGGRSDALGFDMTLERRDALTLTVPMRGRPDVSVSKGRDAQSIRVELGDDPIVCQHMPESLYSESSG